MENRARSLLSNHSTSVFRSQWCQSRNAECDEVTAWCSDANGVVDDDER